jgi:eukaryotic-like serine/threonine-protein kinase
MPSSKLLLERWEEVDTLFSQLIGLPQEERSAFLERSCEGDEELETLLRDLLENTEGEIEAFLATPPDPSPLDVILDDEAASGSLAGTRLGPWQIGPLLGRGGLGVVYRAERVEGGFDQSVAVKFVLHSSGPEVARRFDRERAILASLDHPNIARLFDAGSTGDGRPFIVMELVEGEPITEHCRARKLDAQERVRLFLRVCDAVASAHQRMIVHRDLKPSNILVTPAGHPKLLDFGIAKLLADGDGSPAPGGTELTRVGRSAFSPAYASPEQVRGGPITAASDVFQLGVLLYELLTGVHPHAGEGASAAELVRNVTEFDPPPPSRVPARPARDGVGADPVAGSTRSRLRLRGDLDTIVMKMLRKEPSRRYASVAEVVEDLRRHLDGLPIRARPHGVMYRMSRFARRNRALSAGAGVATVAAMLAGAALVGHNHRLGLERDRATAAAERAEAEAARASAATAFLLDLFDEAGSTGARDTMSVGTLLRAGEERLEAGLGGHPVLRIELLGTLSSAYDRVGLDGAARDLDDRRIAAATEVFGPDDPRTAAVLLEAGSARAVARHWAQAREHLEGSLRIQRALGAPTDTTAPTLAGTLRSLAMVRRETGDPEGAVAAAQEAIEVMRPVADRGEAEFADDLATLALTLRGLERFDESEALYLEAIAILRSLDAAGPVRTARTLSNYASLLRGLDRPAEADPLLEEAVLLIRPLGNAVEAARDAIYISRASLLSELGKHDEQLELSREYDALMREGYPEDHWRVGRSTGLVGDAYLEAGDCHAAEPYLRRSHEIYTAAIGADHSWTVSSRARHATCLGPLGRHEEAAGVLRGTLDELLASDGQVERLVRRVLDSLVASLEALQRHDEAAKHHELLELLDAHGLDGVRDRLG